LVTDAFRDFAGTQIAIEAGGSTQEALYHGPIVADDIFRIVGYGFNTVNGLGWRLATFKMAGANIMAGLEFGLSSIELNDENLIQASGLTYTYDPDSLPPHRLTGVKVGSADIDPSAEYTVKANEFVPMFMTFLGIPCNDVRVMQDTTEYQVLLSYVEKLGTISPPADGRITKVKQLQRQNVSLPTRFSLAQNYPNPFNPTTKIDFQVPRTTRLTLKVFNVLGQELATLADGQFVPGSYAVQFDASRFASGVYFYVLHGNGVRQSRRWLF
jgi:hypothetical protein